MTFKGIISKIGYKGGFSGHRWLFLGITGLFMAITASMISPKIAFANNYFTAGCMGTDQEGYLRIPITFTNNFSFYWKYNNGYFGAGDSTSCYTIVTGSNSGIAYQNLMLLPRKNSDMGWVTGYPNSFQAYAGDTIYFYVSNVDWIPVGSGDEKLFKNANLTESDYFGLNSNQCGYTFKTNDPIVYWSSTCQTDEIKIPDVTITSHTTGFDATSAFVMTYDYVDADDYLSYLILVRGYDGNDLIYSKTFSRQVLENNDSGSFMLYGLPVGNYTVDFYFINYPAGTSYHVDLDFDFTVSKYIPSYTTEIDPIDPSDEFTNYNNENFYTNISPYATSTVVYNKITGVFEPVGNWIGGVSHDLAKQFDRDVAKEQSANISRGIKVMRYYSSTVDQIFGGFPLSASFVVVLFFLMIVGVFKLIMYIKQLIR